jgi:iron complex transport system substrate-binding protein
MFPVLIVLALAWGSSCDRSREDAGPGLDRPRRIVSLSPALTEILFAVGAGDRVVGITDYCDYPPDALGLPRVGGYANPSVESVLALRPDLVVASPGPGNREAVRAMERAGLRVAVFESETLEETLATIRAVARAAGAEARGEAIVRRTRERIDAVSGRVAALPRVRTLFCLQIDPIIAAGGGTLPAQILEAAGGENVVAAARYPRLGIESVIALGPEVIVQSRMDVPEDGARDAAVDYWTRWPDLPAVRTGRVRMLPGSAALRPGPRVADAVEEIAEILHGAGARP